VLFLPVLGPLAFWVYVTVAGFRRPRGGLPFCDGHYSYWPRRGQYLLLGLVATVALVVLAIILAPPMPAGSSDKPHWLFAVIGLWVLGYAAAFMIVNSRAMRPIGGNRRALVMGQVSRRFAAAVEDRKLVLAPGRSAASPTRTAGRTSAKQPGK
jgi:hypothetical protein